MITREMILEELNNRNLKYCEYETSLIVDYLINLYELNLLPENVTYKDLIAKLEKYKVNIVFFDEKHEVNHKWGYEFKGKTNTDENGNITIYIRDTLPDKELYFYHELTHLFQKIEKTKIIGREYDLNTWEFKETEKEFIPGGLVDDRDWGHLFDEVATQSLAEKIYNNKYNLKSEYISYDSGSLRMLQGFEIWSELKNYQMYDYIVSLLLEVLETNKEELIKFAFSFNYSFKNFLKQKCEENSVDFEKIWVILELIYKVDIIVYTGTEEDKRKLYNGESLWISNEYNTFLAECSLAQQLESYMDYCNYFKSLINDKENTKNSKIN